MTNLIKSLYTHRILALTILMTQVFGVCASWGQTHLTVNVTYDSSSSNPHTTYLTAGGNITLRSAIQYANYNTVDTISFGVNGTFRLTNSGFTHYAGGIYNEDTCAYGDLDINKSLTIRGNGPTNTIINGYDERVFEINPFNPVSLITVKISQMTIRGGTFVAGSTQNGGGIEIHKANVTLDTVYVDSNKVLNRGGGIDIASELGTVLVINGCKIDSNLTTSGSSGDGGGGAYFKTGTVTLNNVEISRNNSSLDGGGLLNNGAGITIAGGTISYNQAPNASGTGGGGINNALGLTTISNALIIGNTSPSGAGLGMFDNVTITGTTLKWNIANLGGGGLGGAICQNAGALTMQSCIIDSNSTDGFGGGIAIFGGADSWKNVTIGYDTAGQDGGGVYDVAGNVSWHGDSLICNRVLAGGTTYAFTNGSGSPTPDTLLNVGFRNNLPFDYSLSVVLPVEMVSLIATTNAGAVTLAWQTATEVDNAGFNVLRKKLNETSFAEIASFSANSTLRGAGTSNSPKQYSFTDNGVTSGVTYSYQIQSVSNTGAVKEGKTISVTVGVPKDYALYQNFPNPFNPSTTIRFDLKQNSTVTLEVYNLLGQQIKSENRGLMNAGSYNEAIDMSRFASGVYFYRLVANGANGEKFMALKRMMLVK